MPEPRKSIWALDPDYPLNDWKDEVARNNTRLGYHEWADNKRDRELQKGAK